MTPLSFAKNKTHSLVLLTATVATVAGGALLIKQADYISCNDAVIESHTYTVSSQVDGKVEQVLVKNNEFVKSGALLVVLDDKDLSFKLGSAKAALAVAKNETSGDSAEARKAQAAADEAKAALDQACLDEKRGEALFAKDVISKERLDRLRTALKIAEARWKEAEASFNKAKAIVSVTGPGGIEPQVAQKQALLTEARLKHSYTRIYAPADGYVTRKAIDEGDNIHAGQSLMTVVALKGQWIAANFSERQLRYVKPGQKVEFNAEGYPGKVFRGTVDSIMAGTVGAFSLLPPQNTTDYYVKVTQKVPVKINIDDNSDSQHVLRVGMSVVPMIRVHRDCWSLLISLFHF